MIEQLMKKNWVCTYNILGIYDGSMICATYIYIEKALDMNWLAQFFTHGVGKFID